MHQKVNVLIFFNICSKRAFLEKFKFDHSLAYSWAHLSSLLVKCVEDVACKSSYNNSQKKNERFNLYMFNVIYM